MFHFYFLYWFFFTDFTFWWTSISNWMIRSNFLNLTDQTDWSVLTGLTNWTAEWSDWTELLGWWELALYTPRGNCCKLGLVIVVKGNFLVCWTIVKQTIKIASVELKWLVWCWCKSLRQQGQMTNCAILVKVCQSVGREVHLTMFPVPVDWVLTNVYNSTHWYYIWKIIGEKSSHVLPL